MTSLLRPARRRAAVLAAAALASLSLPVLALAPPASARTAASAAPGHALTWTAASGAAPVGTTRVAQPAATSGTVSVFHVTGSEYLSGIHKCQLIGTESGIESVICADLLAAPLNNGTGRISVWPVLEAYCQVGQTSQDVQCTSIDAVNFIANGIGLQGGQLSLSCSGDDRCPASSRFKVVGQEFDVNGACTGTGTDAEVWTVIKSGASIIPITDLFTLNGNLASQHAIVCD